ncbi:PAS domain S-box protein [Silicimonas algicola]|uniref:histidine kinase n=1 Tax=Silicimonas algicola TaxID=1826607 RepID=A0A316G7N6_9RHOB|nr:HWE histidine kinase domain-containing protein [Silicimonas algicola]AZQ68721.1 PAS domain S-box protein [Silicimonas algicola]PWK56205.1 PAS domain S-box-containing protein [Silicimonas algicola]
MTRPSSRDVARPSFAAPEDAFVAFQNVTPDGFMMLKPVRSDEGAIVDLEWTFVNAAAGDIVGRNPDDLVGRLLLVEMPGNRDEGLFDAYVEVIETGQTWQREFHYDHGGIVAWFRTTAARAGDGLALSFADVSEVHKGQERLRNLIDGVVAFVGVLSTDGRLLEANAPAVAASGLSRDQLIGLPFWDCYWWNFDVATQDRLKEAVATAAKGERVRYDAEIRIAGDQRIWIDFQIAPVRDGAGNVVELIPSGADITERKRAEAQKELLIKELAHRVKNTLATIQSMAGQTIRSTSSPDDFRTSFDARLRSIAASHDLLVASEHQAVALAALIRGQVGPYAADDERLALSGDDILLPGEFAHRVGLVLHELAANASKYGALSTDGGSVDIKWRIDPAPERVLRLDWSERGGPEVERPTRQGFGTRLIERSFSLDGDKAVIDYAPEGVRCRLAMAL